MLPAAQNLKTEVECWSFFLTDEILSKIVDSTNKYVNAMKQKIADNHGEDHLKKLISKYPYFKTTTLAELKAFFGLQYYRAVYQWNHTSVRKFWMSNPIFTATMALHRFYFLHHYIRFDDFETTDAQWKNDRGAGIREVFELWNDRLGQAIQTGEVSLF